MVLLLVAQDHQFHHPARCSHDHRRGQPHSPPLVHSYMSASTFGEALRVLPTTPCVEVAEVYRKGTQGSVLAWRAASLLLGRLHLLY